ncbi:MAG: hypothetical protein LBR25_09685 [Erysipelotrichaceae bacterium]|jgi:hypothetical protein|nr:hypothetical protein [Erysipelotrichaceae bacterium]
MRSKENKKDEIPADRLSKQVLLSSVRAQLIADYQHGTQSEEDLIEGILCSNRTLILTTFEELHSLLMVVDPMPRLSAFRFHKTICNPEGVAYVPKKVEIRTSDGVLHRVDAKPLMTKSHKLASRAANELSSILWQNWEALFESLFLAEVFDDAKSISDRLWIDLQKLQGFYHGIEEMDSVVLLSTSEPRK